MSYMEEIFERIEVQVDNPTKENIMDWLSGKETTHEKRRGGYSNIATQFREPFAMRERIEETTNVADLIDIDPEVVSITNARAELRGVLKEKERSLLEPTGLPRLPRQADIQKIGQWTPLFSDMIEEIASDRGLIVTSEAEWDALSGEQRRIISRQVTYRLTGR